jgi:hypothetical protein
MTSFCGPRSKLTPAYTVKKRNLHLDAFAGFAVLIAIENGEAALSKRSASKGLLPSTFDIRHSIFVLPPTPAP